MRDLELGMYISQAYHDESLFPNALLSLEDDYEITLYGPAFISTTQSGKYSIDHGKLILAASGDNKHICWIDNNKQIFESGNWLENWVEQGTVFD